MVTDVVRRGVQESKNIDYAKQHHTPHCWLPAKMMYLANSTKRFSWLTRPTSSLLMKNVQIYNQCLVVVQVYIKEHDSHTAIKIMKI